MKTEQLAPNITIVNEYAGAHDPAEAERRQLKCLRSMLGLKENAVDSISSRDQGLLAQSVRAAGS